MMVSIYFAVSSRIGTMSLLLSILNVTKGVSIKNLFPTSMALISKALIPKLASLVPAPTSDLLNMSFILSFNLNVFIVIPI